MVRFISVFVRFVSRHRYLLVLAAILALGIGLRLYRFPAAIWNDTGFDESRDILVVQHIVERGESLTRGPLTGGADNRIMNSPAYFYLVALLWFITRSAEGVAFLWSVITLSAILFIWRVGTTLWDRKLGLIAAVLAAVHPGLVAQSRHMSQPNLLPIWTLAFLLVFARRKPATVATICLLLVLLLVPLHIHYGSLVLLPAGLLWTGTEWLKLLRKKITIATIALPLLTAEYLFITWVYTTYASAPYDQLSFLAGKVSSHLLELPTLVVQPVRTAMETLWPGLPLAVSVGLTVLLSVLVFLLLKRARDARLDRKVRWLFFFAVSSLAVAGSYGRIADSYLFSVLPVFLLVIALSVRFLLEKNAVAGWVTSALILVFFITRTQITLTATPSVSTYERIRTLSGRIALDYRALAPAAGAGPAMPAIALAVISDTLPYDGWGTGGLWFFLEETFGQKLVTLASRSVNFYPDIVNARFFYVICDNRSLSKTPPGACLDRFVAARDYLVGTPVFIAAAGPFDLWRFFINTSRDRYYYQAVYR